jgi:hypothetical protein
MIKSAKYLREIKTGKTRWGIEQKGEKERQRERADWRDRERQQQWREKMAWVIGEDGIG